jgi:phosphohistidine swiveling domain-containing protein
VSSSTRRGTGTRTRFARAAAIVADGGTLAAHASLVAREYAIPAAVSTGNATLRLHSGQLVTVDGSAGTVTPHDETSPISDKVQLVVSPRG